MAHTDLAPPSQPEPAGAAWDLRRWVETYFWFILKNVIGWLCILGSPILGVLLPGPGGIPLFLIGFALVTLPGKRRLTTRVMRGGQLPIDSPLFTGLVTFMSVVVTASLMILAWQHFEWLEQRIPLRRWGLGDVGQVVAIAAFALPVTMAVTWIAVRVLNMLLGWIPRMRRFVRPSLRKWGIRLLPTRRKRIGARTEMIHDEILNLDEGQRQRLRRIWHRYGPWIRRLIGVSLTVFIIYFVVAPVLKNREWVEARIGRVDAPRLIVAVTMFAAGLLIFRAGAWVVALRAMGERLGFVPGLRIWALGHLARFIPGRFHQLVRAEMARPYGVGAVRATVATRLEGMLSLAGAALIGVGAAWILVFERAPGALRGVLIVMAVLIPLALLYAAPTLFHQMVPPSMGLWMRGGERTRVTTRWLLGLLGWLTIGIAWQGVAVWLLIHPVLQESGRLWLIMAAWAVAWSVGHLASWSPAGLGVREVVFVGVLGVLLPRALRESFITLIPFTIWSPESWQDVWWAFLFFLSLLLRLATTAAELLLATVTTLLDWRGMRRLLES